MARELAYTMSRPSIAAAHRLASFLLGTGLVLSCTSQKLAGPGENRGPTAKIVIPPGPLLEGSEITFDASSSSDPDGDTLTFLWNVGDTILTGPLATRTYVDEGSYDVTLVVADQQGESDTATARVSVENARPVVSQITGPAGSIGMGSPTAIHVRAMDPGAGDTLMMQIDWKDGTRSTQAYERDQPEAVVAHTYSTVGAYAVELTLQDNDGGVTKRVIDKPIVIVAHSAENRAPTAKIDQISPGPIVEGSVVTFDGASSSDPDGDPLTYRWSTGYQLEYQRSRDLVYYPNEGSFALTLIVTDSHGASDTATMDIRVENAPPTVNNVVTPAGAVLAGTSSSIRFQVGDPGVNDTVAAVQVDWKDGSTSTPTLTRHSYDARFDATAAHTYSTTGTYPVEITARDNDSGVTKRTVDRPILVVGPHANHPPVAHITGPATGSEGEWRAFSGASSTDPDGDSLRITCVSDDGLKPYDFGPNYPGGPCITRFPDDGTYHVSLIVRDDSGAADTASMPVTIENVAPVIQMYWGPAQQAVGIPARVEVRFDDPGTADRYTITVDWGDGTSRSIALDSSFHGKVTDPYGGIAGDTVFHVYQQAGSYFSSVTVRDDDGGMSTMTSPNAVLVFNADERTTVAGYEVFDLGTLGGNFAKPWDLNDRGQVVGASSVANGATHAFLWDESGMHDLGTLGHEGSEAVRINEAGTIAGTAWTKYRQSWDGPAGRSADYLGRPIGALWQHGLGMLLDSTQARPPLRALAMNEKGDVAWTHVERTDGNFGWLWRNGNWQPLRRGEWNSFPYAMNDRGDVVGTTGPVGAGISHAATWSDGSMRDLGVLACNFYSASGDCSYSAAMDINEGEQVVGISNDGYGSRDYHFVLWEGDTVHDLGPASGGVSVVINERGQIAGAAGDHAYFWSDGNKVTLPALGGTMRVVGLSDDGEVVGTVFLSAATQHVFVWSQARGMIDLGTGPDGLGAAWVTDINARGDILGYAAPSVGYGRGEVRAILWRNTQATASR
jgi:probable HAF family extracellular repeat protein